MICRPFLSNMGGIVPGHPGVISEKPLRFTDSPQHYSSTSSNAPTPSPRRKSSSTSNEDAYCSEIARIERVPPIYMSSPPFPDYASSSPYSVAPSDYYRSLEPTYYVPDYQ